MAKTLQFRRGTTGELSSVTGAVGELFVDTTKDTVVVMDGSTAGGFPLQRELISNVNIKTVNGASILGSGDIVIAGGDGGTAYDQDLNTTDDVVFNSALVGDVSIIGNTIGGVDSYGLADTLVVAGDLNVNGEFTINNQPLDLTADLSQIAEDVLPLFSEVYDLGSTDKRWYDLYLSNNLNINGVELTGANGVLTVNGQPIGGTGSSFDQDLNTTDDVVFNSALIGDVSVVGNTIGGVDSYGLADTLVMNSPVEFKSSISTTTGSQATLPIGNVTAVINFGTYAQYVRFGQNGSLSQQQFTNLANIPTGTLVTTNNLFSFSTYTTRYFRFVIQSTQTIMDMYNPSDITEIRYTPVAGTLEFSSNGVNWTQGYYDNDSYINNANSSNVSYSNVVTTTVDITPLSVTETGVNVNGTFTVNGAPLTGGSGSSYDQDLNTTDDVVFNSALIGDVSIVGNTIGGVDSYGLSDTLVVTGDLNVTKEISNTTVELTANWTAPANLAINSAILTFAPGDPNCYVHTYNTSRDYMDWMLARQNGGVVNLELTIESIVYTGTVTLGQVVDQIDSLPFYITAATGDLLNVFSGADSSTTGVVRVYKEESVTTVSTLSPLSVTETGVNVNGTFTVNGAPLTGGSGSSYDQDLNTTDNVVFNSALIGDVSIVGNTIAAVDSYGLADTLTVDGNLNVQFDRPTVSTGSINVTDGSAAGALWNIVGGEPVGFLAVGTAFMTVEDQNKLLSLTPGTVVQYINLGVPGGTFSGTFTVASSGVAFGEPNRINIYINKSGFLPEIGSQIENNFFAFGINFTWTGNITTVETFDALAVTETGVNVNGTFTVNGQPVSGGGTTYDQDLNTTDDVVFDSALIGDVSVVGNTISAVDSYGNSNELIVSSQMSVQLDSNVSYLLTNSSTRFFNLPGMGGAYEIYQSDAEAFSAALLLVPGNKISVEFYYYPLNRLITLEAEVVAPQISTGFIYISLQNVTYLNGSGDGISNIDTSSGAGTAYILTLGSSVTAFSVTESGVNVNGDFTVNGQPVSGGGTTYDQGLNTTDDVVFNSALVGDVSIVGNTIGAVDSYGLADTLVVDGDLEVAGALINPATLTVNPDGSKSVVVDTLVSTTETVTFPAGPSSGASIGWIYDDMSNQSYLQLRSGTDYSQYFTAGMTVTGTVFSGGTPIDTVSFTLTSDMVFNPIIAAGSWVATTAEDARNNSYFQSGQVDLGSTQLVTNITAGSVADYSFDDLGTFSATNIIADSALVGDVSIIGNTIGGVDSYGLADTLVVDGDLSVTGDLTSLTDLTVAVGGGISSTTISSYTGSSQINWSGTTFQFPSDIDSTLIALLQSLPIGSHIKFTHYMHGAFDVVTASSVTQTGTQQYEVSVNTDTNSSGFPTITVDVNGVIIEQTIPTATYGFGINGALELPSTTETPSNATAVVKWAKVVVAGQTYYVPLYQ